MKHMVIFVLLGILSSSTLFAQTLTVDAVNGRQQVIDGFGTCLSGNEGESAWMQNLYYDDAGCSILRMDLVPRFVSPYSDNSYNSPWFHNNPPLPGPENNNVRTYTNPLDYSRLYNGKQTPIAVMGTDIAENILKFDLSHSTPRAAGAMAQAGLSRINDSGEFKVIGSIWSPAPWLKGSSGNTYNDPYWYPGPYTGTPYPFIWYDNFVGGRLDVSDTVTPVFFDGVENTSALTQFARSTAAYVKGIQDTYNFRFYAISIQNELNFETFYNSCTYPLSSQYIAALKAVKQEFEKYPDLENIKLKGPEDLLGGDAYGMWQYGGGAGTIHKNLQYLINISQDAEAFAALDFFCIHGYAPDGVNSAGANPTLWTWWKDGWTSSPAAGIPAGVNGFRYYNKKSWMTETSGEKPSWIFPSTGFPGNGAFSIALKIHQAITAGHQSAWLYWQFSDGNPTGDNSLTDVNLKGSSPKYVAFKHFSLFIRPNSVRLNTTLAGAANVNASAFIHDENQTLTLVLINNNSSERNISVSLPELPFSINAVSSYTSSANNLWQHALHAVQQGTINITVPGYGVTTLFCDNSISGASGNMDEENLMVLFPNPASGAFRISSKTKISSVTVRDQKGQVLYSADHLNVNEASIEEKLPAGLYIIEISDTDGKRGERKLIIK